jgi:hypothetical protein
MEYLFAWSKEIISLAEQKGWTVSKADGPNANQKEVQSKLEKIAPDFVVFNGHGDQNTVFGQDSKSIMDNNSVSLLKNSVTFARSCECLSGLGETAVQNGCRSFVGYSGQFIFPMLHQREANPLQDTAAKPVLEASNQIALKLIKGATVTEAIDASKATANKFILKLVLSEEPYDRASLRALIQNDYCLGFEGDENAKIE